MPYDVALVPCESYEDAECSRAMDAVLEPVGGLDWVRPGMKIAVKVNLVSAMRPETAATTHPALLKALIERLRERGASVILGDSPGGLFTAAHLNHVYDVTGLRPLAGEGVTLNTDVCQKEADYPEAVQAKQFVYTGWLDQADAIIDFCKLKSHGQMGMTNATKNFFGVIPGTMKPEYHFKYLNIDGFANMLVDLSEYFKPRLCICDAVVCMEGNGPTQGSPRRLGVLAASRSCHALDLVCASLIGFTMPEIPTLKAAHDRGLIPEKWEQLSVFGDPTAFAVSDFRTNPAQQNVYFSKDPDSFLGKLLDRVESRAMSPYPKVEKAACVGCGKCAHICPAHAITMRNQLPLIDRNACIHCFCCQEFCPKGAMKVARPLIPRLLNR